MKNTATAEDRYAAITKIRTLMPDASPDQVAEIARWVHDGTTSDGLSSAGISAARSAVADSLRSCAAVFLSRESCLGIATAAIQAYMAQQES